MPLPQLMKKDCLKMHAAAIPLAHLIFSNMTNETLRLIPRLCLESLPTSSLQPQATREFFLSSNQIFIHKCIPTTTKQNKNFYINIHLKTIREYHLPPWGAEGALPPVFLPGAKIGVHGPPGFPTIEGIPHSSVLAYAGLSVFGTSSRYNLCE